MMFGKKKERARLFRSDTHEAIEGSLKRRRMSSNVGMNDTNFSDVSMFEHIMLLGLPKDYNPENPRIPQVLMLYPGTPLAINPDEFDSIKKFAYPGGVMTAKKVGPTAAHIVEEFIFRIDLSGRALYGVCVQFIAHEGLEAFFLSPNNESYVFCLCMLTRQNCLGAHLQFMTHIDLIMNKKDVTRLEKDKYPMFEPETEGLTLPGLILKDGLAVAPGIEVPPAYIEDMRIYKLLERRDEDQKLKFSNHGIVYLPSIKNTRCTPSFLAGCVSLDGLFSYISVENIITIFTAICLEYYTVIHSTRAHRVTTAILALRALLNPLKIQGPLNPILPTDEDYLAALECPVPYVSGTLSSPLLNKVPVPVPRIVVNLDDGSVRTTKPVPRLPRYERLKTKLNFILNDPTQQVPDRSDKKKWLKFYEHIDEHNQSVHFLSTQRQKYIFNANAVEMILTAFYNALVGSFADLLPACFVTDSTDSTNPVTIFNRELFMCHFDGAKFMQEFVQTQMFEAFCDRQQERLEMVRKSTRVDCPEDEAEETHARLSILAERDMMLD